MRALVTGGVGFIGSHLCEELLERGYEVTVLDDFSTGKLGNMAELLCRNLEIVRGSVLDLSLLNTLCQKVDYVFHLAAVTRMMRSIKDPGLVHSVNATGTLNVLLAAKERAVRKVVYASSSSVYGDTEVSPKSESLMPNPASPYGVSKLTGEYYCNVFSTVYGLPTVSLRYFSVYGARQDADSEYAAVIPKFASSLKDGKPVVIFDDGEQVRDFTFIEDVIEATINFAENDAVGVFNIGTGVCTSVNRLARLIAGIMGKDTVPIYAEPRLGDMRRSMADISRASAWGYSPKYDIKRGLAKLLGR